MATEKTKLELFKEMVGTKLADIKQLFELPAPETVAEFVDVKTSDGAVLRIVGKSPVVGAKCMVIDASGETPAADGEYTLEDGTKIGIKGGEISEVADKAEEAPSGDAPAKMDEALSEVQNTIKSITYKYAEIEKKLNDTIEANKISFENVVKENETLKAQNKAMFGLIEAIAGLPVDEPTQTPKQTTGTSRLADFRAEVKAMKAARKELRK